MSNKMMDILTTEITSIQDVMQEIEHELNLVLDEAQETMTTDYSVIGSMSHIKVNLIDMLIFLKGDEECAKSVTGRDT